MSDLPIHYAPARKMLWILGVLALGMTAIGVGIMIVGGLVAGSRGDQLRSSLAHVRL